MSDTIHDLTKCDERLKSLFQEKRAGQIVRFYANLRDVRSRVVIEIEPHRCGWACLEPLGLLRVFVLKPQAIRFAQQRCVDTNGEIRIRGFNGTIEQTLRVDAMQSGYRDGG